MELSDAHFMRLATALQSPEFPDEPIRVTIEQLSSLLCCTPRNVKFILRRLEEKALISWKPGRGRGHASSLSFLRSSEEILEETFQELLAKGKMKEAIELIGAPEVSNLLRERLWAELNRQMGFHSEPERPSGQDVLRMMRNRHLERLDPAFVFTAFEAYIIGQVCNTLVSYEAASDSFLPGLAHTWEHSDNYTRWTFYLRKGVRFHHGKTLTAGDVKYTLERLFQVDSHSLWQYGDVVEVKTEGDYTICFYLSRSNLFFLHLAGSLYMSILPSDVSFSGIPVGTGPFRVANLNEDVLTLTAFDDYYGIRPLLDRVEIWFLPDKAGSDRHYELSGANTDEMMPWNQYNSSIDYPALGCRYIVFNLRREGVHHRKEIRQALRIVYDRVALIRELGGSRYTPADSLLPWISKERQVVEGQLKEAADLLRYAGYAGESIRLAYSPKKEESEEAEWLQKRCRAVGLNLVLHLLHPGRSAEDILQNADLLIGEEVLEDDWEWGMMNFYKNRRNYLHFLFNRPQTELLDRETENIFQLSTPDRVSCLLQAEQLARDNFWMLHGCHLNKRAKLSQSLLGLHTGSFGFLDISKLWVKSGDGGS
ncbi:DNA-binding transcriptional regulator SgrR of sgrS sRNA, contains a MarR-type HTH domain and a solute-binding domain [Paenibacillus sophorae]|uniref:DNA-binding transcriptional regulator SgrR of sgrS sRNA, contains a MarR-type HTH domain and a solute-binding domain n=1 Tax=Paenibacillus sophorae TaxID=1333845 RepID=A0A1H8FT96_9BACL|nr:ABC transporter substrate-binding protein [Paenibacillus sophorae]QWU13973.1 SgrR family transcriptional regulator [Paenibacillus sophorae]SEN34869.1 DNA-binding transcriptional regulator SgrR of sgrS sRNA, contains a MarR-type HTH domain and a solute-binding domain [Paenibacillus sophorae]